MSLDIEILYCGVWLVPLLPELLLELEPALLPGALPELSLWLLLRPVRLVSEEPPWIRLVSLPLTLEPGEPCAPWLLLALASEFDPVLEPVCWLEELPDEDASAPLLEPLDVDGLLPCEERFVSLPVPLLLGEPALDGLVELDELEPLG